MSWTAAVSAGIGLLSGNAQAKAQKKQLAALYGLFDQYKKESGPLYDAGLSALLSGQEAISKGYADARLSVGGLGDDARRRTTERESERKGGAQQSLTSRGLGNTSVLDNARRGIAADTDRALSEIDEGLASIYAQLDTGEASAQQSAFSNIASLFTGQAGQIGSILGQQSQGIGNIQYQQASPLDLSFLNSFGKKSGGGGLDLPTK